MDCNRFVSSFLTSIVLAMAVAAAGWEISDSAQNNGLDFDAKIAQLAFQIAGPLEKEKVKRVIVAELLDQHGKSDPVGRFLADKLSAVLLKDFPALETISFSHSQSRDGQTIPVGQPQSLQESRRWASPVQSLIIPTRRVPQSIKEQ